MSPGSSPAADPAWGGMREILIGDAGSVRLRALADIKSPAFPSLLLVNGLGIPAGIFAPIFGGLKDEPVNVVTWESRGFPLGLNDIETLACGMDAQVEDLFRVAAFFGLREITVLGWSSGAGVALAALRRSRDFAAAVFLCGTFASRDSKGSRFFENIRLISPGYAKGKAYLAAFYKLGFNAFAPAGGSAPGDILGQPVTPETFAYASAPFRDIDHFYAYCKSIAGWSGHTLEDGTWDIRVPCLFLSGAKDAVSENRLARAVCAGLPHAEYREIAEGTHYLFRDDPDGIVAEILAVIRGGFPAGPARTLSPMSHAQGASP